MLGSIEWNRSLRGFLHKLLKTPSHSADVSEASFPVLPEHHQLSELLERSPTLICLLRGPDHVFQVANEQCRRVFNSKDLIGKRARDVLPAADFQQFLDTLDHVYQSEESFSRKETRAPKDRFLDFYFQLLKVYGESVKDVMVHGVDITAQVQAREQVAIEDQRFRLAGEAIPYGVWEADSNGAINYVGKQMLKLMGARPEEAHGNNWQSYIHPEDLPKLQVRVNETMPNGEAFEDEFRIRGADQRYHYVLSKARPVRDASGRVTSWVGLHLDINEKKKYEKELQERERRFRTLAESSPVIIWSASPDGEVDYYNKRWCELTGLGFSESLGHGWTKNVHPDDLETVLKTRDESLRTRKPFVSEFRVKGKEGRYHWLLVNAQPVIDEENKVQSWLGVSIDTTTQKNVELELLKAKDAAESANRLKSAFLANMSHEIRTPLGAIMGFSELLLDENAPAKERENFKEVVLRSGQELTHLIDDILDLSKVESDRLEVSKSRTPLQPLIREVADVLTERAKQKKIELTIKMDDSAPKEVCTDPIRLKQILSNLIGNGIKFTQSGGVVVTVRSVVRAGKQMVEFVVCDSGIGLNQAEQEKIFQPFIQGDNSTTRTFGGTGLGLSLSKKLANVLNGDVYLLQSAPNQGSTFVATIPVATAGTIEHKPEASIDHPAPAPATEGTLTGHKILLVEDSKDNQELIRRMLAKNGAIIEVADNGVEGVEKALQSPHDAILMDIQMPKMDGLEAMRTLKDKGLTTPVIALTAHAMREEKERSMSAGFTDHLTKPVSRTVLIDTLVRHLNHH